MLTLAVVLFATEIFSAPFLISLLEMLFCVAFVAVLAYYILIWIGVPAPFPKFVFAAAGIFVLIWLLKHAGGF